MNRHRHGVLTILYVSEQVIKTHLAANRGYVFLIRCYRVNKPRGDKQDCFSRNNCLGFTHRDSMLTAVRKAWARGGVLGFYQGLIPWAWTEAATKVLPESLLRKFLRFF